MIDLSKQGEMDYRRGKAIVALRLVGGGASVDSARMWSPPGAVWIALDSALALQEVA